MLFFRHSDVVWLKNLYPRYFTVLNIYQRNHIQVQGVDGPVLLFGHGFGCNQTMWDAIIPAFADTHRVVTFDYVGSGLSDPAAFDAVKYATLSGYAQDVLDVCDVLGLERDITFVGHSVSCNIGLLATIARPSLFKQVVMVGPSPCFLNYPPEYLGGFDASDLQELLDLMDQNYIGWAQYMGPLVSGLLPDAPVTARLTESFCSTDPVTSRTFARATFFADNRADLPRIPVPSLLLQHRDDALVPLQVGEYMAKHMPQSTLCVIEAQGHSAHLSRPELVIQAMKSWLARH